MDAAGAGNTACIQLLLDNGGDLNLPSTTGHLPIHKAAYAGHYRSVPAFHVLKNRGALCGF